jgi:hypothetical protein
MDMVNLLWPKVENLVVIVVGVQVIGWGANDTFDLHLFKRHQENKYMKICCVRVDVLINMLF